MKHPLLNPTSKHYGTEYKNSAIARFEQKYTVDDLLVWATITAQKYREREGLKLDICEGAELIDEAKCRESTRLKDCRKRDSYQQYVDFLARVKTSMLIKPPEANTNLPAAELYKLLDIQFD